MENKLKKFKSPGVYTKEVDVSGWSISKNQIRKGKINKVLGVKNIQPIIAIPIGCINGFIVNFVNSVVVYNYDELR